MIGNPKLSPHQGIQNDEVGMLVIGMCPEEQSHDGLGLAITHESLYNQKVWEVVAVDLPFIVIQSMLRYQNREYESFGKPLEPPRPIDLRTHSFKKVSEEFAEAITAGR